MSKDAIIVHGTALTERNDGIRVLTVSTKTGNLELEFTPEAWKRLADSAQWFFNYSNGNINHSK